MSRAMSAGMSCEQVCMQSHFCARFPRKSETRQNYFAFEVWRERDLLFLCCLAWKRSQTYFLAPVRNRFATACRVIEVGSLLIFLSFLILDEPGDNIISDQINQVIKTISDHINLPLKTFPLIALSHSERLNQLNVL